jgi:cysteinyl-tRNA synthetase
LARIANNHPESSLAPDLRSELVKTFDYYGNQVLGLFTEHITDDSLLASIKALIAKRDIAREAKDWSKSDSIREELIEMGIEVQDTPEGTKWRRI